MFATDVIARGIDFPLVQWIIQIDPPQDPMFYIHRIGRTARKGLEGNAILLLLENEKGYLEYLGGRGVKCIEHKDDSVDVHYNLAKREKF